MSDPKPVLGEEQAAGLCHHCEGRGDTRYCKHNDVRAVERAVLEAVGGQYDALNRGIIADLAPVNSQPHSYARGAVLEAVDTITALRAFHDRAIEILGSHGALDQGVEVDALTWLADVLTQADQLRAELEQQLHRFQHGEAIESDYICPAAEKLLEVIEERDAARRELEEARREAMQNRLDYLEECNRNAPGWGAAVGAREEECRAIRRNLSAALDRAREDKS